jgi:hypothetical protein
MRGWRVTVIAQIITTLALVVPRLAIAAEYTCTGGDVACLIDAINVANATLETDTLTLGPGTYTLKTVNNIAPDGPNGLPPIMGALAIIGVGTPPVVIERSLDAPDFRLVYTTPNGNLVLYQLTLRNGSGAITNNGTLILSNSLLSGNVHGLGAGISNNGVMAIVNSTVSEGDGISNDGSLSFVNSTLAGSGDISNDGSIAISNSTFAGSGNISNDGVIAITNGTIASIGDVSNDGWVFLQNTILFLGSGDCDRDFFSLGYNLLGDRTGCRITHHDSDLTGPLDLGQFTDDGIPGHGHFPLLSTSTAIGAGNSAVCPTTDQLGNTRVGVCDIGAIEFIPPS